ncbi:hypothetical protein A3767_05115 [Oleiphilus sp. HI0133]|nr:hypothetical protein A3767_05115 [Oleiphilus sp. HI0133]
MSKANSDHVACSNELSHVAISTKKSQHFVAFVVAFTAVYLIIVSSQGGLNANTHLWLLGAVSVSLAYTFGFTGLCSGLALTFAADTVTGFEHGALGAISNLLFTASMTLTMLLPYFAQDQEKMSSRMLASSAETSIFIGLAVLSSSVSVGLYVLSANIGLEHADYTLSSYLHQVLASVVMVIGICPLLILWRQKQQWPALPRDPKEYSAWCMSLILISFMALAFGRSWISLCALLLVWATLRFSWFGCCLALAITTLFISPAQNNSITLPQSIGVSDWVITNFELLAWFFMSATSLYFASLLADKRRIEKNLEARVLERTGELDSANRDLQLEIETRHTIEASLEKTNKRYRALIETAGIPVIVINDNYLIKHWNGSSEATSGYRYESVLGKDFLRLSIPKEEHESFIWRLRKAAASNTNQENVETSLLTSSGTELSMLWNINYISDEELDEHGQFLLIGQDISSIRKTQNQLHYLAHFDSLTGAANRRLFEDRCKQSIETAKRYDSCLALLSIDIDHFKKINDTLGHDGGDDFLIELVSRFQRSVRKEDTIARLGGDEFAILLPNVSGQDGAEVVARNILESITKPVTIKGNELIITSSIGITLCPEDASSYEALLKNADMAMYRAKNNGRNNVQFYCEDMNSEMIRQIEIEKDLRVALKEQQFSLHYQPIVDTKSGEIIALEALTRWNHPEKGVIMPDEFINIADQTGLLQQIGEWSINQLCAECKILSEQHVQELPIAFNLTRRQYNHPRLLQMLSDACETHRFNPKQLILELSENTLVQVGDDALKILRKLKSFGCLIAIDGFGTGSSSLNQLNALPIDIIKIDRSLVTSCLTNKQHRIILETLLTIAKQLGIKTFASGVETPAQEAFLQKNKCHYVQGFLYSQALSIGPLIDFLAKTDTQEGLHSGDQITLPFGQDQLRKA